MKQKRLGLFVVILVVIGIGGLLRFSGNVRAVDSVGLFGSGLVCGVALMNIISIRRNKIKTE